MNKSFACFSRIHFWPPAPLCWVLQEVDLNYVSQATLPRAFQLGSHNGKDWQETGGVERSQGIPFFSLFLLQGGISRSGQVSGSGLCLCGAHSHDSASAILPAASIPGPSPSVACPPGFTSLLGAHLLGSHSSIPADLELAWLPAIANLCLLLPYHPFSSSNTFVTTSLY